MGWPPTLQRGTLRCIEVKSPAGGHRTCPAAPSPYTEPGWSRAPHPRWVREAPSSGRPYVPQLVPARLGTSSAQELSHHAQRARWPSAPDLWHPTMPAQCRNAALFACPGTHGLTSVSCLHTGIVSVSTPACCKDEMPCQGVMARAMLTSVRNPVDPAPRPWLLVYRLQKEKNLTGSLMATRRPAVLRQLPPWHPNSWKLTPSPVGAGGGGGLVNSTGGQLTQCE